MSFYRDLLGISFALALLSVSCSTGPAAYKEDTAIAIWDLEDWTPGVSIHPNFGEILSAKVIETLKEIGEHTVVERERLVLALEELNLG
ncbi:MAG: hypothetical protein JRJ02_10490, partial [Deltaproteobacteria bacterium]|nr:hypothetical protein [Deltaproteobacteria bacterium]